MTSYIIPLSFDLFNLESVGSNASRDFLGQTGTYIEPTKAVPWLALSKKVFKSCACRCFKNALSGPAFQITKVSITKHSYL